MGKGDPMTLVAAKNVDEHYFQNQLACVEYLKTQSLPVNMLNEIHIAKSIVYAHIIAEAYEDIADNSRYKDEPRDYARNYREVADRIELSLNVSGILWGDHYTLKLRSIWHQYCELFQHCGGNGKLIQDVIGYVLSHEAANSLQEMKYREPNKYFENRCDASHELDKALHLKSKLPDGIINKDVYGKAHVLGVDMCELMSFVLKAHLRHSMLLGAA